MGDSLPISVKISSIVSPVFCARTPAISSNLPVWVAPGSTLFTVIPNCPNSFAIVLLQLATAPRMVFDTPKLAKGCLTEVEIILMMRPNPAAFIPGIKAWVMM